MRTTTIDNLHKARSKKNDEFYTQLKDIERELGGYKEAFRDKIVYCNCDNPETSKFVEYFKNNFEKHGLKKLIVTSYNEKGNGSYLIFDGTPSCEIKSLNGNGDFRSEECVDFLKQSDIVVTNPPFSMFRKYVAQLFHYDKKFLIIGNKNALTNKEIFKLFKEDKMWIGNTPLGADIMFDVTEDYAKELLETKKNGAGYRIIDGVVKGRTQAAWFTNLEVDKRHEDLILEKRYTPEEYPKFDHYDAINVNNTKDIPGDYSGLMGVPVTFLDRYNPEQFEIIDGLNKYSIIHGPTEETRGKFLAQVDGKPIYVRIIVRNKKI